MIRTGWVGNEPNEPTQPVAFDPRQIVDPYERERSAFQREADRERSELRRPPRSNGNGSTGSPTTATTSSPGRPSGCSRRARPSRRSSGRLPGRTPRISGRPPPSAVACRTSRTRPSVTSSSPRSSGPSLSTGTRWPEPAAAAEPCPACGPAVVDIGGRTGPGSRTTSVGTPFSLREAHSGRTVPGGFDQSTRGRSPGRPETGRALDEPRSGGVSARGSPVGCAVNVPLQELRLPTLPCWGRAE